MQLIKTTGNLPIVEGITLDQKGARILDDGFSLEPQEDGSWILTVSFSNVPHYIEKDTPEDKYARLRGVATYEQKRGGIDRKPIIKSDQLERGMSLNQRQLRRAVTVELHFDPETNLNREKTRIYESFFMNRLAFANHDLERLVKTGDVEIKQIIDFFVLRRAKIIRELDEYVCQRQGFSAQDMPRVGASEASKICFRDVTSDVLNIIGDIKAIARDVVTQAFLEHEIVGMPLIKPEYGIQVMRSNRPCLPFAQKFFNEVVNFDPKIGISKPLRDYGCIVNMRALTAYLRDEQSPYTADQIAEITEDYVRRRMKAEKINGKDKSAVAAKFLPVANEVTDYVARVANVQVPMTVAFAAKDQKENGVQSSSVWGVGLTMSRAKRALKSQIMRASSEQLNGIQLV